MSLFAHSHCMSLPVLISAHVSYGVILASWNVFLSDKIIKLVMSSAACDALLFFVFWNGWNQSYLDHVEFTAHIIRSALL